MNYVKNHRWALGAGLAIAMLFGFVWFSNGAKAADLGGNCCVDLEERVAEQRPTQPLAPACHQPTAQRGARHEAGQHEARRKLQVAPAAQVQVQKGHAEGHEGDVVMLLGKGKAARKCGAVGYAQGMEHKARDEEPAPYPPLQKPHDIEGGRDHEHKEREYPEFVGVEPEAEI